MESNMTELKVCGCGRSPTSKCIRWHSLSEDEYQDKLKEAKKNAPKIKKRKLEEIEAEADAEIKRLGL